MHIEVLFCRKKSGFGKTKEKACPFLKYQFFCILNHLHKCSTVRMNVPVRNEAHGPCEPLRKTNAGGTVQTYCLKGRAQPQRSNGRSPVWLEASDCKSTCATVQGFCQLGGHLPPPPPQWPRCNFPRGNNLTRVAPSPRVFVNSIASPHAEYMAMVYGIWLQSMWYMAIWYMVYGYMVYGTWLTQVYMSMK